MPNEFKIPGCCTWCDAEVFEVLQRNPETRAPIRIGAPLDTAYRVHYRVSDGSMCSLAFCENCVTNHQYGRLGEVWEKCQRSQRHYSLPGHPDVADFAGKTLLGVDCVQKWPSS